jgi:hypothetical protein
MIVMKIAGDFVGAGHAREQKAIAGITRKGYAVVVRG